MALHIALQRDHEEIATLGHAHREAEITRQAALDGLPRVGGVCRLEHPAVELAVEDVRVRRVEDQLMYAAAHLLIANACLHLRQSPVANLPVPAAIIGAEYAHGG